MRDKKKIIIYSLIILLALLLFGLFLNYYKSGIFSDNSENAIIENVEDKAVSFINELDFQSAYDYYSQIIQSSNNKDTQMVYKVRLALTYLSEGEMLNRQEEYFDKAKMILDTIDEREYLEYGEYYRVLGYGYEIIREYDKAAENYKKALGYAVNDKHFISITGGLAHTFMLLGNPYKAEKYLEEALKIEGDNIFLNRLYFRNLGTLGNYEKSKKIGEKIVKSIENIDNKAEVYYALSSLAFLEGNNKEALGYVKKCLEVKETYGLCYFARAKVYYFNGNDLSFNIAKTELQKALSYEPQSSVILELLGYIKEASNDINGAIATHTSNLNYIVEKDTNLYDNERNNLRQRLLTNLSRLYSKQKDSDSSLYYLNLLRKEDVSYPTLKIFEAELVKENGGDFEYLLKNNDLSDYLSMWGITKIIYNNEKNCTDKDSTKCLNSTIYNNMYKILFIDETFRQISLGAIIDILGVKNKCSESSENLDYSVKSMCLVFTSSHDFLLESNKKQSINARNLFNK